VSVRSFFAGLWRGLDGLRKVLHLIMLLVIFGTLLGVLLSSTSHIPAKAALVISPDGELVEQLSGEPVARALEAARGEGRHETLLWDLTDAIRAAAADPRIQALALEFDKFDGGTQPTLAELAGAIREFRATGKKVIAYGNELDKNGYYLAAQADETYLDPQGFVLIDGYDRYRMYFKEVLDKLGVDINVFRVGQFKSAVETYTRTNMSPEDREESSAYLGVLWASYQQAVTHARKLAPDAVDKYVGTLAAKVPAAGGDAPHVAQEAGLITGIKTQLEVEKRLIGLVGEDKSTGSFRAVSVSDYLPYAQAQKKLHAAGKARIGVIVASGEILDGEQPPGVVGGDSTAKLIREARLDTDIKALVLRVDSPGGSVAASEEIYRELKAFRAAGKPLVVSMSGYAASGGYYISAGADEIWAHPATLTGSIGIFAIIPTVDRTLAKVGVSVDGVGTTPLSGALRIDRPMSAEARALLQSQINRGYDEFLERVASGRSKSRADIDAIAQGHVWAGTDAQRLGLVDHLGSFDEALKAAAQRARLSTYAPEFIEPELTWAEQLLLAFKARAVRALFSVGSDQAALAQLASRLDPVTREAARLSRFSVPNRVYAYCFCEVR